VTQVPCTADQFFSSKTMAMLQPVDKTSPGTGSGDD
jgi:hypothetical protein